MNSQFPLSESPKILITDFPTLGDYGHFTQITTKLVPLFGYFSQKTFSNLGYFFPYNFAPCAYNVSCSIKQLFKRME
jgi:hypothetical protein